jgi:hypothetical protein
MMKERKGGITLSNNEMQTKEVKRRQGKRRRLRHILPARELIDSVIIGEM